jgi:hypothetical protein
MRAVILALAVIATTAAPCLAQAPESPAPAAAAPANPNAQIFNSGAGLVIFSVKPESTADFESVLNKTKEALMKSDKPERKQQAASWKVYRFDPPPAAAAAADAKPNVTYFMVIDPAVKDADYYIITILAEVFPTEVKTLFESFRNSLASMQPLSVTPLLDFGK